MFWDNVRHVINRPCGHSFADDCACEKPDGMVTTTTTFDLRITPLTVNTSSIASGHYVTWH